MTAYKTHFAARVSASRRAVVTAVALAAAALAGAACKDTAEPDANNPSLEGVQDNPSRVTVTQMVRGVLEGYRQNSGFPLQFSIIGRDAYNLQSAEPRNTGELLGTSNLDPGGFGAAVWGGQYRTVRTAEVLLASLPSSTALTDAEKETARGIVNTIKALELFTVWAAHDTAGAVVDVSGPPETPAPILCRDPAINAIAALLDEAQTQINAGVASGFPFSALPAGFANFNTKATFLTFNRAWKGKVDVYRRQYQSALTALSQSFVDTGGGNLSTAQARTLLDRGPTHVFSSSPGDALSTLFASLTGTVRAHPSVLSGAETGPNGIDARYATKITTATSISDQGVSSNLGFIVIPTNTSPVPIIRNEELILLRAQANHGLGNLAAASRDVNFVRTKSGNLAPKTHNTLDELLTDLLYNKRYSGLYETGMRWVDMRLYNKLGELPKDLPTHKVHANYPVPSNEWLARGGQSACSAQ
jgi:starch-binding outer membrane protein, SusD/RagB family